MENFSPREEDIISSGIRDKRLMNQGRYSTSCDVEVCYRNGKSIAVFYDINPVDIKILDFSRIRDLYNDYFDALERRACAEARSAKELKEILKNIEDRRRSELGYLGKIEREFLESMVEEGKFPFALVEGDNVYFLGNRKRAVRRFGAMMRAIRNTMLFDRLAGSLPSAEPLPELKFLYAYIETFLMSRELVILIKTSLLHSLINYF